MMALDRSPESFSPQMNSTSLFLWFQLVTHGVGPVLIPRGIMWIKLTKVYKEMLNTKYQSSNPSSFREEEFWSCFLCSYVPTCDPRGEASFDPTSIICTNLVDVHREMLKTKYQSSIPSSFRGKEFWRWDSSFLCSNLWPRVGANLDPRSIIWTHLVEVHQKMLHTNIKALALTVWDKKVFKNFLLYLYVKSENPQQRTNFLSRARILNILVEGN